MTHRSPTFKEVRAIVTLGSFGYEGTSSSMFGAKYFGADRPSKGSSMGGGGDYAAQMTLGRLRKLGWARTDSNAPGSSVWLLTWEGQKIADWWSKR